jgi:tetratricopeptide (TPR) repeat protein
MALLAVADPDPRSLPSPLVGPGVGELKRAQERKIERSHRERLDGNLEKSEKLARRAGSSAPARLALLQLAVTRGDPSAMEELADLCSEHPGYAAAWITLSRLAEQAGDESLALEAARRTARIWPEPRWQTRVSSLERRWIDDRITEAERLSADGRTADALAELDRVAELAPERTDARLVEADVLYTAGRTAECLAVLETLADEPEAVALRARIAEDRRDWQTAMEFYSSLPDAHPDKRTALERVQILWRMTMLPPHSQTALASTSLTRGQLAAALVAAEPRLEALPGGDVPVMSDIVDDPGQREIITVVRLGLMAADQREHRFWPDRPVDADAVRTVVDRARVMVGLPPLTWCEGDDVVGSDCTPMTSPPTGGAVVNAILTGGSGSGS